MLTIVIGNFSNNTQSYTVYTLKMQNFNLISRFSLESISGSVAEIPFNEKYFFKKLTPCAMNESVNFSQVSTKLFALSMSFP